MQADYVGIIMMIEGRKMDELCKKCWNEGCRENEVLRCSKIEVCKILSEEDLEEPGPEYDWWDDRTY